MQMNRVLVSWSGGGVQGAAVNVLSFAAESGVPNVAGIHDAYFALKTLIPPSVTISVAGSGDTYDDANGELTSTWSAGAAQSFLGQAPFPQIAAGVGACVTWNTGLIVAGRRLRGRTFLVPLSTQAYDNDGTLTLAAQTALENFGTALLAVGGLGVWHRPTAAGNDGAASGVTSFRLRDKVAVLRSRRD